MANRLGDIGRRGQNVRLAAQLTGWRIDIFSESKHLEMNAQARTELAGIEGLDHEGVEALIRHGFRSCREVADAEAYEIAGILSIEEPEAEQVVEAGERALEVLILDEAARRKAAAELPPSADEV